MSSLVLLSDISLLTPSLPQPVQFPDWMMHGRACKRYNCRSYNIYFQCYAFWWRSFHAPVPKRRQTGWRVSNFALSWIVFKWYHGSEGVNVAAGLLLLLLLPLLLASAAVGFLFLFWFCTIVFVAAVGVVTVVAAVIAVDVVLILLRLCGCLLYHPKILTPQAVQLTSVSYTHLTLPTMAVV